MRSRGFQEDRARSCQNIEELRRIFFTEAERAINLRNDELCTQKGESRATVNQFVVQIQELQDNVKSLNVAKELDDPENCEQHWIFSRSQSICEYSESKRVDKPRLLLAACYTTELVGFNTFLKTYLLQMDHHQHSSELRRIWDQLLAVRYLWIQEEFRNELVYWKEIARIVCDTDTTFCQDVFGLESSLSCRMNLSSKFFD